jgi:hypothetical protein
VRIAIFVLVLLLVLVLIAGGLTMLDKLEERDAQYRHLYELYVEDGRKALTPSPADDAQAIRNHQALTDQYKAMIDELYEHGEQIALIREKRQRDAAMTQHEKRDDVTRSAKGDGKTRVDP